MPSDNEVITDPVESWLYFFRRADEMTPKEIQERFYSPAFKEAAEILDMIQRTPQQRDQYELRLKAQRDERARLEQARLEGEAIGEACGEARGLAHGRIELLLELLGGERKSLEGLTSIQLASLEIDLRRQLRERGV